MNVQHIFYAVGIFFSFVAVYYFAYEYLVDLTDVMKNVLLVLVVIIFYFVAETLAEKDI